MPPIFPNVGQIREEWLACLYTPLSAIGLMCNLSYVASDMYISTFQFNHPVYNEY